MPLLAKRQTYFKSTNGVKTIFLDDVYKCRDRAEATDLLGDTFAEDTLVSHLETKFGAISEYYNINFNADSLLSRLGFSKVLPS